MLTLVAIIYVFMCWISNWNILWPVKMLVDGGLGDKAIAIVGHHAFRRSPLKSFSSLLFTFSHSPVYNIEVKLKKRL